jgi:tRNA(fMet)-specific endonuclease VapC
LRRQIPQPVAAVGPHDLIIAATALAKGYIVTTRHERSFPRIPGLAYQRW